jgi:long-chain acyl-CoA synthetase
MSGQLDAAMDDAGPDVSSPLRRAELVAGDEVAVVCGNLRFTYAETSRRCRRLIDGLRGLGLGEGDRVAVIGTNCHRYLELYQAVPAAGMLLVPLNPRHAVAELRYALEDSGARVLFSSVGAEGLHDVVDRVIDLDAGYEALIAAASGEEGFGGVDPAALAGLFYTGGTTGAAKGVMLTHRNLTANAMHLQACWRFDEGTRWLIAAPMFHAAGSIAVLATVWNGGQHVVLASFDPGQALDLIAEHGVTHTLLVPTMLAALTDEQSARPRDVSRLRHIAHGGAPIATETVRRAHAAFPDAELLHIYGATETSPIATLLPHEERLLNAPQSRSCGRPAVGVEVAILDLDGGGGLGAGQVGELAVRGPNVMAGYWNKPQQTAAALIDGWYRTGDLGYRDSRGYVYIVDRAKDMIVTGGENVYSTEVEEALYRHPAVAEAAVFGIPDPRWGEAVHAVVVPRAAVKSDELRAHCRSLIADYKVPKTIELRAQPLPKSAAGKLLKRELRASYWEGHKLAVGGA